MSDKEKNAGDSGTAAAAAGLLPEPPLPDEHTTVPNPPEGVAASGQAAGGWEMPKPKFQQTSGYLPQGYLKDINPESNANMAAAGSEDTTQEQKKFAPSSPSVADGSAPATVPAIEPQPDLLDQLILDEPVADAPAPVAVKSGPSVVAVVFGVVGIIIFIAIFIAAVYFLLLGGRVGSGTTF